VDQQQVLEDQHHLGDLVFHLLAFLGGRRLASEEEVVHLVDCHLDLAHHPQDFNHRQDFKEVHQEEVVASHLQGSEGGRDRVMHARNDTVCVLMNRWDSFIKHPMFGHATMETTLLRLATS